MTKLLIITIAQAVSLTRFKAHLCVPGRSVAGQLLAANHYVKFLKLTIMLVVEQHEDWLRSGTNASRR